MSATTKAHKGTDGKGRGDAPTGPTDSYDASVGQRCCATNQHSQYRGAPCKGFVVGNGPYCAAHDPARAEVRSQGQRRRRAREREGTNAATMPHSATDSPGPTDTPTCAGTRPDGTLCGRPVRREHDYCLLHDPIRAMIRNSPEPRKHRRKRDDTEWLVQQVRHEREHDLTLIGEAADG
jgi:hypothetical protein